MAAVKMESPPLTLESLPTDLLLLILSFLDYRDLINCCYVSRRLSQLSSHDPLWRRHCKKYCPISEEEKARKNQCWKSLFFDTYSDVGRYIDHYAAIRKAWDDLKKYLEPRDSQMVLSLKDKMSAKRKSYSVEYKKGIVEDSRGKNLTAFCKEKKLDVRMVRKWRAEYDNLSQQVEEGNAKKRKCGSGRQPLFPELEDIVCEWVADKKAKALVVRRADIQAFALAVAPQLEISPEEFKASQHWLDGFLQRYELSLRSTTLFRET